MTPPAIVIVESPYAGDTEANIAYLWRACLDCHERGEVPFASHGFYTQYLDDKNPAHRERGIQAGYTMWWNANIIAFYIDRGWSPGMEAALARTRETGHRVEYRSLTRPDQTGHFSA